MSYQVLARKWRPNSFQEMAGQEHVLQALINALDNDRLHHAYVFTGTRGVGKTTIARILSKCLNCEVGVSSKPCGTCASCEEIAAGRFIDLMEIDAASRTGVDDMRELLDNVQYAPARGRYKIYLIDEVHMLSKSSFAALLKTLEEPPPHVKFLFATTDPHKLPITVLSRCLQFNLKNLSAVRIAQHLQFVLEQEKLPFEELALKALARAADGSMRDALSLTDQAIGHGGGQVNEADVNAMLGTIDRSYAMTLCQALTEGEGSQLLAQVEKIAELSPDYEMVLADMLSIWHQVAILQTVPEALDNAVSHYSAMLELASSVSREDIQLYYQICMLGRKDLHLAPDLKSGFEMILLRALAFRPDVGPTVKQSVAPVVPQEAEPTAKKSKPTQRAEVNLRQQKPSPASSVQPIQPSVVADTAVARDLLQEPSAYKEPSAEPSAHKEPSAHREQQPSAYKEQEPAIQSPAPTAQPEEAPEVASKINLQTLTPDNWMQVHSRLDIGASLGEIASHCLYSGRQGNQLQFIIDSQQTSLYDSAHQQGLAVALSDYFGEAVSVEISFGVADQETPRAADIRQKQQRLADAIQTLNSDPDMIECQQRFDATLDEKTVRPQDADK
jgi:DNA polymerase-3 subunit gamma/tau